MRQFDAGEITQGFLGRDLELIDRSRFESMRLFLIVFQTKSFRSLRMIIEETQVDRRGRSSVHVRTGFRSNSKTSLASIFLLLGFLSRRQLFFADFSTRLIENVVIQDQMFAIAQPLLSGKTITVSPGIIPDIDIFNIPSVSESCAIVIQFDAINTFQRLGCPDIERIWNEETLGSNGILEDFIGPSCPFSKGFECFVERRNEIGSET